MREEAFLEGFYLAMAKRANLGLLDHASRGAALGGLLGIPSGLLYEHLMASPEERDYLRSAALGGLMGAGAGGLTGLGLGLTGPSSEPPEEVARKAVSPKERSEPQREAITKAKQESKSKLKAGPGALSPGKKEKKK